MAITKILARKGSVAKGIRYILNKEKTESQVLTAAWNCELKHACAQMEGTKQRTGKTGGVQYYHIIQSFRPGEIAPELALQLAQEFAEEYLPEYQVVIATHVDKSHIHSHLIVNSVNYVTGKKLISTAHTYYQQVRAISDRLCRKHGLSIVMAGDDPKPVSYNEWLRQKKGFRTFRSMLMSDLEKAIDAAVDYGHFLILMEDLGYEIKHGSRLGFRLHGQERYMYPQRRNPRFSEEGIRSAISGNLEACIAGTRQITPHSQSYRPYYQKSKLPGFLGRYMNYLSMLERMKQEPFIVHNSAVSRVEFQKFEQYKAQMQFMIENAIVSKSDLDAFQQQTQSKIAQLTKQRTVLNVRKKRRQVYYRALADEESLAVCERYYAEGNQGLEAEALRYRNAAALLDRSHIPREELREEKAQLYQALADVNAQIRQARQQLQLCRAIADASPRIEAGLQQAEPEHGNQYMEKEEERV